MGQYYLVVALYPDHTTTKPHAEYLKPEQGCLKMMEHSWIGNSTLINVERLLHPNGRWHKLRLVWAGDYASPEAGGEENLFEMTNGGGFSQVFIRDDTEARPAYLVNHDKREYVDMKEMKKGRIHPLPLLMRETDDWPAGGDYRGADPRTLCGSWSRNRVSMESCIPPEEFRELKFDLV